MLPKELKKDILRAIDPYHGDNALGTIENVGGKIASFFIPFSLLGKVSKGVGAADKASDF